MRHIEGLVCIVRLNNDYQEEILFGPNRGLGQGSYENFYTNGLTPFSSFDEARSGRSELLERTAKSREFNQVGLGQVVINLAEVAEDIFRMECLRDFVVANIQKEGQQTTYEFFGRADFGRRQYGHLYGSPLTCNGFRPFPRSNYKMVLYYVGDTGRQAGFTTLATFQLKRLRSSMSK